MSTCREAGAKKIIVTGLEADAQKLALAKEFGADHTIDVENEDVKRRVQEITNGLGARVVVEQCGAGAQDRLIRFADGPAE